MILHSVVAAPSRRLLPPNRLCTPRLHTPRWHSQSLRRAQPDRIHSGSPSTKPEPARETPWGKLAKEWAYSYYNWRRDTFSDLQLLLGLNALAILVFSLFKRFFISAQPEWWQDVYESTLLTFGEAWPDVSTTRAVDQLFSVFTYLAGLTGFALVIALVEQAVLEVLEERVSQGSIVLEENHVLVLGWCKSQTDIHVITSLLLQLCAAHRSTGGTIIVLLTQRAKLDMEQLFKVTIPEAQRFGTRFVFRQGSPLLGEDLTKVAAGSASAIIIVSDNSRTADEADSQALRTALLLDGLEERLRAQSAPRPKPGHVVVELHDVETILLTSFADNKLIAPMPSILLNARRLASMIQRPVLAELSESLWNFQSDHQLFLHSFPQLTGVEFSELPFYFPDAVVLGAVERSTGYALLNPLPTYQLQEDEDLILMRPTAMAQDRYQPLAQALIVPAYNGTWKRGDFSALSSLTFPSYDGNSRTGQLSQDSEGNPLAGGDLQNMKPTALETQQRSTACMQAHSVPQAWISVSSPRHVLVCGWGEQLFMKDLLLSLDQGAAALPPGSTVTFANPWSAERSLIPVVEQVELQNIRVRHFQLDPLKRSELARLDAQDCSSALVLVDQRWMDAGTESEMLGEDLDLERDVLRLDAMSLRVQLNLRLLLMETGCTNRGICIICQKAGTRTEADTKFEDSYRLPLGFTFNMQQWNGRMLSQVAFNPRIVLPRSFQEEVECKLVDANTYANVGESLSFWQLVRRAQGCRHVLLGWNRLPKLASDPMEVVICPKGSKARCATFIWNEGDDRLKFVIMTDKEEVKGQAGGVQAQDGAGMQWLGIKSVPELRQQQPLNAGYDVVGAAMEARMSVGRSGLRASATQVAAQKATAGAVAAAAEVKNLHRQ